ncbi:MAG: hypothetical protein H0V40_05800, partial [Actinobacteria bacterium]|nr:hypothetical protein [Actinomycetota bacterium]
MRHRRPALLRRVPLALAALLAAVPLLAAAADGETGWRSTAPLPLERTEVAAARVGGEILVAGGFLADGSSSGRVDAYAPSGERWRRLPDLSQAVHHAAAASFRGRLYVLGGYAEPGRPSRAAFVLERGGWRRLPAMPEPRAAAGAAIVAG